MKIAIVNVPSLPVDQFTKRVLCKTSLVPPWRGRRRTATGVRSAGYRAKRMVRGQLDYPTDGSSVSLGHNLS